MTEYAALPDEPGHYLDKDGGYWFLSEDGAFFDPCDVESENGDPAQYAPFTRLFPAAHFAKEHDELQRELQSRELHHFEVEQAHDDLLAQVAEAQALRNKPGAHKEHVLAVFAQSPRGTVARLRAEGWEACASAFNGRLSIIEQPANPFGAATREQEETVLHAALRLPEVMAELDGLRAQIEQILKATSDHKLADGEPSESADFGEGLERGASIKSQAIRRILAQSPRGMVARIQADEQTALSALIHGRFEEARGRHGVDPDRVARFILDSNWLAARDRAVREAALEEAAQIAESSTNPAGFGHGSLNEGSRSRWYAHGKRDSAAAIRAAANPFASSGDTTNRDK